MQIGDSESSSGGVRDGGEARPLRRHLEVATRNYLRISRASNLRDEIQRIRG